MMSPAAEMQTVVAPAGVLRAIAHELRQPLGTIESIAYYLSLVLPREDEKIQEQLNKEKIARAFAAERGSTEGDVCALSAMEMTPHVPA